MGSLHDQVTNLPKKRYIEVEEILGNEIQPAVDSSPLPAAVHWDAVALPNNCCHHGRVEAVGHAVLEIPLLQNH